MAMRSLYLQVYLPPEVLLGTSPPEDAAAAGAAAQVHHLCWTRATLPSAAAVVLYSAPALHRIAAVR